MNPLTNLGWTIFFVFRFTFAQNFHASSVCKEDGICFGHCYWSYQSRSYECCNQLCRDRKKGCFEYDACKSTHGGWSEWDPWTTCPATCENPDANRTRTRTCTNPKPKRNLFGLECQGESVQFLPCQLSSEEMKKCNVVTIIGLSCGFALVAVILIIVVIAFAYHHRNPRFYSRAQQESRSIGEHTFEVKEPDSIGSASDILLDFEDEIVDLAEEQTPAKDETVPKIIGDSSVDDATASTFLRATFADEFQPRPHVDFDIMTPGPPPRSKMTNSQPFPPSMRQTEPPPMQLPPASSFDVSEFGQPLRTYGNRELRVASDASTEDIPDSNNLNDISYVNANVIVIDVPNDISISASSSGIYYPVLYDRQDDVPSIEQLMGSRME